MRLRLLAPFAALALLAASAPSASAAARTVTLGPGAATATWTGAKASGLNVSWFTDSINKSGRCGSSLQDYCDETLIHLTAGPAGFSPGAQASFRIEGFSPQASDFDLRVYESDASGALGTYLGSPTSDNAGSSKLGDLDPRNTWIGDYETVGAVPFGTDAYYLMRVVYFTVADGTYQGKVRLTP